MPINYGFGVEPTGALWVEDATDDAGRAPMRIRFRFPDPASSSATPTRESWHGLSGNASPQPIGREDVPREMLEALIAWAGEQRGAAAAAGRTPLADLLARHVEALERMRDS